MTGVQTCALPIFPVAVVEAEAGGGGRQRLFDPAARKRDAPAGRIARQADLAQAVEGLVHVLVQQSLDKPADPSLPPPVPEIDPGEPTYSVVMIRNLGNLRLIPALFTLASLALFLVTCLVLHWRDLGLREKGLDV